MYLQAYRTQCIYKHIEHSVASTCWQSYSVVFGAHTSSALVCLGGYQYLSVHSLQVWPAAAQLEPLEEHRDLYVILAN